MAVGQQFKIKPGTIAYNLYQNLLPDVDGVFTQNAVSDPDVWPSMPIQVTGVRTKHGHHRVALVFTEEEVEWVTPVTRTEWGVRWTYTGTVTTQHGDGYPMTEQDAQTWVSLITLRLPNTVRVVRREVTEWTEVPQ